MFMYGGKMVEEYNNVHFILLKEFNGSLSTLMTNLQKCILFV